MRAHLVAVRGGALFLSSADAIHLLEWLDRGVAVCDILRAIERAADSRRKKQSRIPLTLGQAKRHLGKPTRGAFSGRNTVEVVAKDPLEPLVQRVSDAGLSELAAALRAIPVGAVDAMGREASLHMRTFHVAVWRSMTEAEREACRVRARADLGDLRNLLDEVALTAIVEENARDSVRTRYGWLSMATVWDLLEAWNPEGA